MKGFLMNLDIAEIFFKRCAEQEANTLQERIKIMSELIHEENVQIIKESQMGAFLKNKNVLRVKGKKNV